MTTAGHNSDPTGRRKEFYDRLRTIAEDKHNLAEDERDVKKEAKAAGEDVRAMSVAIRHSLESDKKKKARLALEESVDLYKHALGILD
jgi:uncharacterized protein (UPF0335 family)